MLRILLCCGLSEASPVFFIISSLLPKRCGTSARQNCHKNDPQLDMAGNQSRATSFFSLRP
jgi:hypothetical protein